MKVNWDLEKNNLINMINENLSYEEIGRYYGVTGAAVKKSAKKLGINLPIKRKKNPNEHFNKGKNNVIKNVKIVENPLLIIIQHIVQINVKKNLNIKILLRNGKMVKLMV